MEKKVLLKKLVEEGRHIRKEFTPTAIVSDNGVRPIGEFWDANKTIDVIVNGAHAMHDTVKEVDEFIHGEETRAKNAEKDLQDAIDAEETRATAAEQDLEDTKQDKITSTNKLDYSLLSNTPDIDSLIARIVALEQAVFNN